MILLPTLLAASLGASGCAAFQRQPVALQKAEADALQCSATGVQQLMQQAAPGVIDALSGESNGENWQAQLGSTAATVGESALTCAVAPRAL